MNVLLLGYDGFIGWGLIQRLIKKEYNIVAIDNYARRSNVKNTMHSFSATKITSPKERIKYLKSFKNITTYSLNISKDIEQLHTIFENTTFDTVINLAHQPSGPYSLISNEISNYTLQNNIIGTNNILWLIKQYCPQAHYLTIGSTGEYDHTLDIPIEEGYVTLPNASKKSIFPRRTNSIYHDSKIANTYLIDTLSRMWKIKSTDVQQSIVYGLSTNELKDMKNPTRFDTDAAFGTCLNKFILQASLGQNLTVYGAGEHIRGFISLNDSIQALMIAIENATNDDFPDDNSPRVWNQVSEWHSINEIASIVQTIAKTEFNLNIGIDHIENPRFEITSKPKFYSYKTDVLKSYGYKPTKTLQDEIKFCMNYFIKNKDYIDPLKTNAFNNIYFN